MAVVVAEPEMVVFCRFVWVETAVEGAALKSVGLATLL
jgi:hypothetical protein